MMLPGAFGQAEDNNHCQCPQQSHNHGDDGGPKAESRHNAQSSVHRNLHGAGDARDKIQESVEVDALGFLRCVRFVFPETATTLAKTSTAPTALRRVIGITADSNTPKWSMYNPDTICPSTRKTTVSTLPSFGRHRMLKMTMMSPQIPPVQIHHGSLAIVPNGMYRLP